VCVRVALEERLLNDSLSHKDSTLPMCKVENVNSHSNQPFDVEEGVRPVEDPQQNGTTHGQSFLVCERSVGSGMRLSVIG
jgi:hypothetical protein